MTAATAYDELPYRSYPVEWTAPERLALASLLHGGPRAPLASYDLLEIGCGDGSNLLALAAHRPHGRFVGIDAAASRIEAGRSRVRALGLANLELLACDLRDAGATLEGQYDYIVAHGVFSWISDDVRDALLALCAERLRPGGLLYLNYNARPGWTVRGMVREHLCRLTQGGGSLAERAGAAQAAARQVLASLTPSTHPWGPLIGNEYAFVAESDPAYVAHEYLSVHNVAYWRSEFAALVGRYGFDVVADADFDRRSGRADPGLAERLEEAGIAGTRPTDVLDLLSYRQLCSPVLARHVRRRAPQRDEIGALALASPLEPLSAPRRLPAVYRHPSGFEVEARVASVDAALRAVQPHWPHGVRLEALFGEPEAVFEDLVLLHRHGLVELRAGPPLATDPGRLHLIERAVGGHETGPYHDCERVDVGDR